MVHSLAVKVQASSTPKVSCHAFALLAFEPVTLTNQYSSATIALSAIAEMQASAGPKKTCNIFGTLAHEYQRLNNTQPIFQLIDVSITNKDEMCGASQLAANEHKGLIKSKMQWELVDFSSSKTISIAKIDTTSIAFQLMAYSTFDQFSNNSLSLSHESSTKFKLVVASVTKEYSKGSTCFLSQTTFQVYPSSLLPSQSWREHYLLQLLSKHLS
jgi:hypothetical protein